MLKFSRRHLLGAAAVAAASAGLTACDNPYFGGQSKTDGAEIRMLMNNWGQIYNDALTKIGTAFEQAHAGTKLKWDFAEDWKAKLLTQINGNVAPDVSYTNWIELAALATSGAYKSVDDLFKASSLKREDFLAPVLEACVIDDKMAALPGGADFMALFWNKDLYSAAGLDPNAPPKTGEELMGHSLQILQKGKDGTLTRVGYVPSADQFIQWAFIHGGGFYDAATKTVTANHEANVEALQWLVDYVKQLDPSKLAAFAELPDYTKPGNPFASKQSAYIYSGFWAYDGLDQGAPDIDYGVAFFPTMTGAESEREAYLIQGWQWAIPRNAPNPDKAWEVMKFSLVDNAARMGYETLNGPCYLPQFPAFQEGLTKVVGEKNRLTPYLDVFTKIGEAGRQHWPSIPAGSFYYDQVSRAYDKATRGEASAKDALAEVQTAVAAKVKEGQ